ncbi:MAG: DUF58 domain-containing protein [Planctomycetota bacterium]|nr:DUF58 domain-containing protein [Planctomycetota bacterium]
MKAPLLRWLSPPDLSRVSHLQLLARGVVEGVSGGLHRSHHVGSSIEFKEHRPYVPGDETRTIDWKLFGKTDRLYIRQYEDETNLRCTVVIDQSGSMKYSGSRSNGISKHEFAIRLAACLSYMLVNQQDAVGLAMFDSKIRSYIPPRSRPNHLQTLLEAMAASKPGSETDLSIVLQGLLNHCKRRGLVFILSDCFGDAEAIVKSLALLRSNHQEIVVFQIWDDDELDFPFQTRTMFQSLELETHQMLVDPTGLRSVYLENLKAFRQELEQGCMRNRVDLISVKTSDSFSMALSNYIASRRSHG